MSGRCHGGRQTTSTASVRNRCVQVVSLRGVPPACMYWKTPACAIMAPLSMQYLWSCGATACHVCSTSAYGRACVTVRYVLYRDLILHVFTRICVVCPVYVYRVYTSPQETTGNGYLGTMSVVFQHYEKACLENKNSTVALPKPRRPPQTLFPPTQYHIF